MALTMLLDRILLPFGLFLVLADDLGPASELYIFDIAFLVTQITHKFFTFINLHSFR